MERVVIKTSVQASIEKVWEYWTNPEHIKKWNFASDEWCCPRVTNILKPDEKFSWRMEAKDGSFGFDFEGVYTKIIDMERISYAMSDGRKVDIEFIQNVNEIEVRETFDAEGTNSDEQQRAGWQAILDNFRNYVDSQ